MMIGPHSDCSLASQVEQGVADGNTGGHTPFTDTVTDNANYPQDQPGATITFTCNFYPPPPGWAGDLYYCVSADPQDFFEFPWTS